MAIMADADDDPEHRGPTVAASANECLECFQKCLSCASSIHPRELSMVEDQVARFSSWATGIGVFAPGSASMDHRLRYAPEVQIVVTGLLESLNYRCQTCLDILTSIAKSLEADAKYVPGEELPKSLMDIAAEIGRLNKISNTIRRASKDTQALKASNFQIKDDEGNDVESILLEHFTHHIGDRFPNLGEIIQQRLARAMLLRRKRILYRRHRQGSASIKPQQTVPAASITLPNTKPAASSVDPKPKQPKTQSVVSKPATATPSQIKSATTLAPEKFKAAASSPSVVSASKTVALSSHEDLVFPSAPGVAVKKRYEQLKIRRINEYEQMLEAGEAEPDDKPRLLELLDSDLQGLGEITCPYCLYALPAQQVFDERKWQNHVKDDLDPYVCLFEDCDQPDVLYNHSDEWVNHLQQHRKFWRCTSHRELEPFSSSAEYITHMQEVHATKLSDNQLRVMANRNSRKMTKLFPSCPLCGKEDTEIDGRLEDHLAGHLRSLALKSLPSYQDEIPDDVENENNSIDISRPKSRSTVRGLREDEDYVPLPLFTSQDFWDQWKAPSAEHTWSNFQGSVHMDLDLTDHDTRVISQFFDTLSFQHLPHSTEDDPVIQFMLGHKMYDRQIEDDELNRDPSFILGSEFMELASTVGEPSHPSSSIRTEASVVPLNSFVESVAKVLEADNEDQKAQSDLMKNGAREFKFGADTGEADSPAVVSREKEEPMKGGGADPADLTTKYVSEFSEHKTVAYNKISDTAAEATGLLIVMILDARDQRSHERNSEVVTCQVTFGDHTIHHPPWRIDEHASKWAMRMELPAQQSSKEKLKVSISTPGPQERLIGEASIDVQDIIANDGGHETFWVALRVKERFSNYQIELDVAFHLGKGKSTGLLLTSPGSSRQQEPSDWVERKPSNLVLDMPPPGSREDNALYNDLEADEEASDRAYSRHRYSGEDRPAMEKRSSGVYVNGQKVYVGKVLDFKRRERQPKHGPRERVVIVDAPPTPRVPGNSSSTTTALPATESHRRPVIIDERNPRVRFDLGENHRRDPPPAPRHRKPLPADQQIRESQQRHLQDRISEIDAVVNSRPPVLDHEAVEDTSMSYQPRRQAPVFQPFLIDDEAQTGREPQREALRREELRREQLLFTIAEENATTNSRQPNVDDETVGYVPMFQPRAQAPKDGYQIEALRKHGETERELQRTGMSPSELSRALERNVKIDPNPTIIDDGGVYDGNIPRLFVDDPEADAARFRARIETRERELEEKRRLRERIERESGMRPVIPTSTKHRTVSTQPPEENDIDAELRELRELRDTVRRLESEQEGRENARSKARRQQQREEEAQRQRLIERMQPRRRITVRDGSQRQAEYYSPVVYRSGGDSSDIQLPSAPPRASRLNSRELKPED